MRTALFLFYLIITLWSLLSVIFHGSRPTKSLGWALTILGLPFAGPIFYYLFGINRRKFKLFKLRQTEKQKLYNHSYKEIQGNKYIASFDERKEGRLAKLIRRNELALPYSGNKVLLLNGGEETFDAIFSAIKEAKHFIHLQYYIIEKGELVDRLYGLLKEKITQGVEVRMIYDSFGSYSLRGNAIKRFKDLGVKAYSIMPLRFGNLLFTLNYRNHRKIVIVDGEVGFTGGVNVSDKYIKAESDLGIWEDLHVELRGPAVNGLHRVFIKDYHFASDEDLLLKEAYLPESGEQGKSTVQLVSSGPDSKHPAIMYQYLSMINMAEDEICIANPYFIPGTAIMDALKIAALSGTRVRLLVPRQSDSFLAKYSMFSRFETLLSVGVEINLRSDFSHSKAIVIDGKIASVGSGNFDYRSFEHNFETNALIYDADIAKAIVQEFDRHCSTSEQLEHETFKKRPLGQKFLEGIAKFFSPLL